MQTIPRLLLQNMKKLKSIDMDTQKVIAEALKISVATKALEFGENILDRVPALFNKYHAGRKAIVLADKITWKVGFLRTGQGRCPCYDLYHHRGPLPS